MSPIHGHEDPWADIDDDIVAAIRRDERHQLAELLRNHASTLASFAGGPGNTIQLVAVILELDR